MSKRARFYFVAVLAGVLGFAYGKLSGGWSDIALVAGMAGLIAMIGTAGNFWLEFAPDGAFRRKPRA
jgi:hypothetical protein